MLQAYQYRQDLLVDSGQCCDVEQLQSALRHMCTHTINVPIPQCVKKLTRKFLSLQCCEIHHVYAISIMV